MMKAKSYATLKRKLDKVFSEWVRRGPGNVTSRACVSCGRIDFWQRLHAGHFVSRVRLATRWDPENVHCQCSRCNIFLRGNAVGYARFLERKYGPKIFATLDERSRRPVKYRRGDLQAMIEEYQAKLDAMDDTPTMEAT